MRAEEAMGLDAPARERARRGKREERQRQRTMEETREALSDGGDDTGRALTPWRRRCRRQRRMPVAARRWRRRRAGERGLLTSVATTLADVRSVTAAAAAASASVTFLSNSAARLTASATLQRCKSCES
jgi:hypothetical protein